MAVLQPGGAALLDRVADYLEARAPALARMEAEDAGKTLAQATAVDIPRAVANFRFFAGAIRHAVGTAKPRNPSSPRHT